MAFCHSSSQPEFTFAAVSLGLVVGCLICFTNLSLGLSLAGSSQLVKPTHSFADGNLENSRVSIQSALIGFLVSSMLPKPLTPQEFSIVVQTTVVGTVAGFVGISSLHPPYRSSRWITTDTLTWITTIGWCCSVAFLGK